MKKDVTTETRLAALPAWLLAGALILLAPLAVHAADCNGNGREDAEDVTTADATTFSLIDLDGDSDLDAITAGTASGVHVHVNDSTGKFAVTVDFSSLPIAPVSLAASDLDLDGDTDIAFTSLNPSSVQVLWNGEESPVLAVNRVEVDLDDGRCHPELGCRAHAAEIADVDNDGDLDFVVGIPWQASLTTLLNIDGELVAQPNRPYGPSQSLTMDVGDLNGDGNVDLVTADVVDFQLRAHLGNGDGTFDTDPGTVTGQRPVSVKLADLDGDDDLDAVVANDGNNTVSVLFNDGEANFELQKESTVPIAGPTAVEAADFDGDGFPEVVVADAGRSEILIFPNTGDGTFSQATRHPLTNRPGSLVVADMDGSNGLDVVASTGGARVSILINRGDGRFERANWYTTGQAAHFVNKVDFNGDGNVDVLTANETIGTVSVLIGVGDGGLRKPKVFEGGDGLRFVHGGDIDGDGAEDIITANRRDKTVTVLYNATDTEEDAESFAATICTATDFHQLSAAAGESSAVDRFVKYTLPVGDGTNHLERVVFQNTRKFLLHEDFLTELLPDQFEGLSPQEYNSLVGVRATRNYFVGTVSRLRTPVGHVYGFGVFARWSDPGEQLAASEVKEIYDELRDSFRVEPFAYFPSSREAIEVANGWDSPDFPIHFGPTEPTGPPYEPYTRGIAYGVVRILDQQGFAAANGSGDLSFQDVIILAEAAHDIEGVVSAVVTAQVQDPGSHLTVRLARRGSPNAYPLDALERFAPFDGKLVRVEVKQSGYDIEEASLEDAEAWWAANQPVISVPPSLDPDFDDLSSLVEITAMDLEASPFPVEARFGGKASGLARLQGILEGEWSEYQEVGFAIPMHYYIEFMRSNRIASAIDPERDVSYEEYLRELFADKEFQANSRYRFQILEDFRRHIVEESEVDEDLVLTLALRVLDIFSTTDRRARFRSSSNVDDALEFNGAGLYDSLSVCAADELDLDDAGPSHCDSERPDERGIARGLKRVWASLWNFRAYEERAFFQVAQNVVAMGILVNRAFVGERANGVAFTGNPNNPSDRSDVVRYVVNAQLGEEPVVSPEPGVLSERDILEMEDGQVVEIVRAVTSSLVPAETYVLSDDELRELGALLWHMDRNYPVDTGDHSREEVLLDIEFKIESTGDLAVKQVRPLLLSDPGPPPPTFELVIPQGTYACGRFDISREPRREYELKSTVRFADASVLLPTGAESFPAEIVEELIVGPDRQVATPDGSGFFTVQEVPGGGGEVIYRFEFEQRFTLGDGTRVTLALSQLEYVTVDDEPVESTRVLDETALADDLFLRSSFDDDGALVTVFYSSCTHANLPLSEVRAELAGDTSVLLEERHGPEPKLTFGPASLVYAALDFAGEQRQVGDYFNLVYSAQRHNENVIYWVVLGKPIALEGLESAVHAVAVHAPSTRDGTGPQAFYLGEDFDVLSPVDVLSFEKESVDDRPTESPFRRGDVDTSTRLDVTDPISLLGYLFLEGDAPACADAADANDDGDLNLSDAVAILNHLFAGQEALPDPFESCRADPTPDELRSLAYSCE